MLTKRPGRSGMSVEEGHAVVTEFLERHGVPYEVVEHERTQTAAAEARAAGMPPADVAKTVVLRDQGGVRLAVIPASHRLDLHKVKGELGSKGLRLVTEQEMAGGFADFEGGGGAGGGHLRLIRSGPPEPLEHEIGLAGYS